MLVLAGFALGRSTCISTLVRDCKPAIGLLPISQVPSCLLLYEHVQVRCFWSCRAKNG